MAEITRQREHLSPEEAAEVIREATRIQSGAAPTLTPEEVTAMGRELGISAEAVEKALAERAKRGKQRERMKKNVVGLLRHTTSYVTTIGGLAFLDFITGPGWWVQWVAAGWGIGLVFHALGTVEKVVNDRLSR